MRIHYLQHVPFEDLGSMQGHFTSKGFPVSVTRLYNDEELPPTSEFDWLVIMGGPMSVHDHGQHPWLEVETRFIHKAIVRGKIVLGICLGAQLIAASLGAPVSPNSTKEIGWFTVTATPEAADSVLAGLFSAPADVFHWHGDTFALPPGATLLAQSAACRHQAFSIGKRVLGLQFHLETTPESASALLENCRQGLEEAQFIQSAGEILAGVNRFDRINDAMSKVLARIEAANT